MNPTPSAEVICVGTELLLGEVLNSNAQFLGQQLAHLGIPHFYQTVVGDNATRLQRVLATACERADLLILTGGLGPTPDDLTTETLATFFDVPLLEDPDILVDIDNKFAHRGRPPSSSNRKQALIPAGAQVLPNPLGSAPGIIWHPFPALTILTFPGVPIEMQRMWQETAIPYLRQQGWGQTTIYSRVLRFWGIPESTLAEKVAPLLALSNPTVAPYASQGEAQLRITTQATSATAAQAQIDPIEVQLRQLTGLDCYGADQDTLASVVGELLQARSETLAVAESCTGGGLGQRITAVPGSSGYFLGGIIAYENRIKTLLLQVSAADLEQQGAVSPQVAAQMAQGVQAQTGATWGLSITGVAGPGGGTQSKPIGLVYIGLATPQGNAEGLEYRFSPQRGRDWVRHLSVCTALDQLRRKILRLAEH